MNNSKDLIPSEDEIKKITAQMMATDPARLPVALMQVYFARLMMKVLDKLRGDLDESIKELEKQVDEEPKQ